jgi:transcriptional regulator with XRE-family HTH domain
MANQLRKIREMRGLSIDQLAQRVGASRSKLYKLENGSQRLTDVWFARLADALAVAPGDFLATGGPSIPVSHYISSAFSELAGFDIPPPLEQLSPPRRLSRAEDCMACEVYDDSCDGIYPKGSLVRLGTKADVTAFKDYMRDLYTQVLTQARMGKSLAETKAAVDLSKYQSWGQFKNWSQLNIEGAYERIQMNRRGN